MPSTIGSSARPFSVSAYSTRGEGLTLHDALLLERAQAQGEGPGGDPGQGALQLAEAGLALREVADEQQGPLAAHHLGGAADGTRRVGGHLAQHFTK
jgi:hypothetical protein